MECEYSKGARVGVPGKTVYPAQVEIMLAQEYDRKPRGFLYGNRILQIALAWPKIPPSLFIMSSQMTLILRISNCSRAGFAQRRCLSSALRPSNPIPAKACCLRFQQYLPVSVSKGNCRSYAAGGQGPPGGTYRMKLGKDQDEEKSALEKFGVDLTSKARDGKLDPVIGRDSVRRCLP